MKVKPYSAADLLRQNSPRKFVSSSNRFSFLRDESPAPGNDGGRRFRSPSVKRKPDEQVSYSSMVSKNLPEQNVSLVQSQALEQVGINPLVPKNFFSEFRDANLEACRYMY